MVAVPIKSGSEWLERAVPGVAAARRYERRWLRTDIVAGVVLATILVPQGMAYAELAGLPAVTGLYTTIACLVPARARHASIPSSRCAASEPWGQISIF